MKPAAGQLREKLEKAEFRTPGIAVISTVDLGRHGKPADIRDALVRQLYSPVRWTETVRQMIADGATHLVECGPGKVLAGLNRRIERRKEIVILALEDTAAIDEALTACEQDAPARRT
jgi:[acyl-carrier-protein] S-malonyltransferase